MEAKSLLSNPPSNASNKKWRAQEREARNTLSEAAKTNCHFYQSGECRDGNKCLFKHSSSSEDIQKGTITLWKPVAPNGAYAFINLSNGESLFASSGSFEGINHNNIRVGMRVQVSNVTEGNGKRRVAGVVSLG